MAITTRRKSAELRASGSARPGTTARASAKRRAESALEPDLDHAVQLVMELMAIPGRSGQEGQVAQYVAEKLREAGAPAGAIRTDDAHHRTPLNGEVGNLICTLPGTTAGPRRLLMAHMDTVPICVGSRPLRKGNSVRSADKNTGLGADDRAGVAVVLAAALEILRRGLPHPPLTFFWAIQEEVGLYGARHVQPSELDNPQLAFNWDGSAPDKVVVGATGGYRMLIELRGRASHAGAAPAEGISAIAIAALAIADLVRHGWHGDIHKGSRRGTSNVGVIRGGDATNVVTNYVESKAEARSHDPRFRRRIVQAIETAFRRAASAVRNTAGQCGKVKFTGGTDYEAFRLRDNEACVVAAEAAVRSIGLEPYRMVSNGGLDANWMTAHGIPTVTLGCGQNEIHTTSERLDLTAFRRACRIALRLATGAEKTPT